MSSFTMPRTLVVMDKPISVSSSDTDAPVMSCRGRRLGFRAASVGPRRDPQAMGLRSNATNLGAARLGVVSSVAATMGFGCASDLDRLIRGPVRLRPAAMGCAFDPEV